MIYLLQLRLYGITSCKCTPSEGHLLFQSLLPAANTASLENWNRTLYLGQCEAILWRFWERFIHLCKNKENVDTEVAICRRVSYETMYAVIEAYENFYTFWLKILHSTSKYRRILSSCFSFLSFGENWNKKI